MKLDLFASGVGGKSHYMLYRFVDWYNTGNRKPENVNVIYHDVEGDFWTNFQELSKEEQEYKINLVYFMCAYGGGFPHAAIQVKELTHE
jgi:hypothetical protein